MRALTCLAIALTSGISASHSRLARRYILETRSRTFGAHDGHPLTKLTPATSRRSYPRTAIVEHGSERPLLVVRGCRVIGWVLWRWSMGAVVADRLRAWSGPAGRGSGRCDGEPVAVELEEVVSRRDQPPFASACGPASALEASDLAVELDLAEHRFDSDLALAVKGAPGRCTNTRADRPCASMRVVDIAVSQITDCRVSTTCARPPWALQTSTAAT